MDHLFALRGVVLGALAVIVVLFAAPDPHTVALGTSVVLPGLALRAWAFAHLGPAGRTRDPAPPSTRATTGPYRWFAHPVYAANLVIAAGVFVAAAARWEVTAVLAVAVVCAYVALARREAQQLASVPGRAGVVLRGWPLARSERSTWITVAALLLALGARSAW